MTQNSPPAHLVRRYQADAISTASREKILMMMLDGALKFTHQAQNQMATGDISGAGIALGRLQAIVGELNAALDHVAGGSIARDLARLYHYASERIVAANISRRRSDLDIVLQILSDIREGFDGAITKLGT